MTPLILSTPDLKANLDNSTIAKNNQTGGDDAEISISKFTDNPSEFNKTLKEQNITRTEIDSHLYYNSTFKIDPDYGKMLWVDMNKMSDMKVNDLLSKSHRRAAVRYLIFIYFYVFDNE